MSPLNLSGPPEGVHQQPRGGQCQHGGDAVGGGGRRRPARSEDHGCTGLEAGEGPTGAKANGMVCVPAL